MLEIANPMLLDSPPESQYEFPFAIPADNTCSINLNSGEVSTFKNDLLSVNSHFCWAGYSWGDSEVGDIFRERLPLKNLRFPGGTVGNFYDWETDGFYNDEWTFLSPSRKKLYESGFRFDIDGYAEVCKSTGASSTLMFNVIQDDV